MLVLHALLSLITNATPNTADVSEDSIAPKSGFDPTILGRFAPNKSVIGNGILPENAVSPLPMA